MSEENHLVTERREKLARLRAEQIAFPNHFRPDAQCAALQEAYADREQFDAEALEQLGRRVRVAGRVMLKRIMGKASFATLKDAVGTL